MSARNREQLRQIWLRAVEGGIEAGDLRYAGHALGEHLDAVEVVRLVQRRQHDELFELADSVGVEHHRCRVAFAAMDHAMADGNDLAVVRPVLYQPLQQRVEGLGVLDADRQRLVGDARAAFVLAISLALAPMPSIWPLR